MNNDRVAARIAELMQPINQQIMMCDDRHDQLMLASAMMVAVKDLFDLHIGEEGRKQMFKELT
jgi:hypothetical protein